MTPSNRLGAVIAVGNQKGGAAKTTNTVNLAAALGLMNYKVLIIDLDPNAWATRWFGIPTNAYDGTFEYLIKGDDARDLAITENLPRNVSLLPSRPELRDLQQHLSQYANVTDLLRAPLQATRPHYDFIFLDTPPDARADTTVAAYCAAEWFLVSSLPHAMAVEGLQDALRDIADARNRQNPNLEILGLLFSGLDKRTNASREVQGILEKHFAGRAFSTGISQAIQMAALHKQRITVFQSSKPALKPIAAQYRTIAQEIVARVTDRDTFLARPQSPAEASDA